MKLEQIQQSIPPGAQTLLNWTAFTSALGWVFTTIVPAIVGVLSGVWLGIQIYTAWKTRPWSKRRE
jgi:hypothetical protein